VLTSIDAKKKINRRNARVYTMMLFGMINYTYVVRRQGPDQAERVRSAGSQAVPERIPGQLPKHDSEEHTAFFRWQA
jgi:hypothetical protein